MRDLVAALVAIMLVLVALRMATSLHWYKRSHATTRRAIGRRGQSIIAEIPGGEGLRFFTEDATAFYWNDHAIPKSDIRAVRVLINGASLSARVSSRFAAPSSLGGRGEATTVEGIERDRWDVAIDVTATTVLVECGAIRERVSQELARQVFEAVGRDIASREADAVATTLVPPLHGDGPPRAPEQTAGRTAD